MVIRTLLVLLLLAGGCTRMRFVVEAVPAEDELTETEVLRDEGASASAPKIALIDVSGLIVDAERPGLLRRGENPVSRFNESMRKAAGDHRVRGVVIRINSPGGGVTACDILHREVLRFKEQTGRPVVILMADVAASGGYYLACAGDEIVAHPTTVTGSIGVIIQTFNFSEGMHKIGIQADAITRGRVLCRLHRGRRRVPPPDFARRPRVDRGRPGDHRPAGGPGRRGRSSRRKYHRPIEYVGSAYGSGPATGTQVNLLQLNLPGQDLDQPGFYYLWDPGN
jgi:hypothetical protein